MVPTLQKAIAFRQAELTAERLFRDLLERKLNEATPEAPVTPDQIERLIFWYKTKTREHRALLENDGRAFRMILARHRMASDAPANVTSDKDAFLATVGRMPRCASGGPCRRARLHRPSHHRRRAVLCPRRCLARHSRHASRGGDQAFVLAQKAHYATFTVLHETPAWQARPAILDAAKHLSPAHYPALVDFVRDQPWFRDRDGDGTERVVAVYLRHTRSAREFALRPSTQVPPVGDGASRKGRSPPSLTAPTCLPAVSARFHGPAGG